MNKIDYDKYLDQQLSRYLQSLEEPEELWERWTQQNPETRMSFLPEILGYERAARVLEEVFEDEIIDWLMKRRG